ncbi:MAG: ATP-binding protein [Polaromonas sp.]|uniref:sensor histidine kinase n=1 Tax=Polaromonas sp. TaxID=1869339 RepID=UPI0027315CA1|nr:sensor histidine kinase [Polaromonas sp.]MDP2451026.1 ATP-binding protein [Polaromonas sp.]MDP3246542.1 ATP-binding protein [Polaromonas sp.]MDP3755332.1 ATP-binding protein [Polaromonas sp.]
MYSILPALVSALFLGYGLYVVAEKGFTRVSTSFLILCITTVFWQTTWAVLFQVDNTQWAGILVKAGYLLILFLPTSLYQFLTEISERQGERRLVFTSYAVAAMLAVLDLGTNWIVDGYHDYFFGYYPKAGILHPLHVLQTVLVVSRGLYITFRQQQVAPQGQRIRLRLCIASVLIYFFAAIDYLCNYGVEFYPPGVVFIAISLGLIAVAVMKYDLMSPVVVAATVAHEMRTPLATIRLQAEALAQFLPELNRGYELAVSHGLCESAFSPGASQKISDLSHGIRHQVDRSNAVIDMMLASARMEQIDTSTFRRHRAGDCVTEALETYPFSRGERERVSVHVVGDFEFHGSSPLFVFVLFNLLKNSLYALKAAGKGTITITLSAGTPVHTLTFVDTGTGIAAATLPKIFDTFFTTKKSAGAGIGLAFCRRVMASFGGKMRCESVEGQYTLFAMEFPAELPAAEPRSGHPGALAA